MKEKYLQYIEKYYKYICIEQNYLLELSILKDAGVGLVASVNENVFPLASGSWCVTWWTNWLVSTFSASVVVAGSDVIVGASLTSAIVRVAVTDAVFKSSFTSMSKE